VRYPFVIQKESVIATHVVCGRYKTKPLSLQYKTTTMAANTDFNLTDFKVLTDKTAALFYSESEKRLIETINTFNIWSDKAFKLLSLLLPSIVLLTGYIYNDGIDWNKAPAVALLLLNIISIVLIVITISPYSIQPNGTLPSNLFVQDNLFPDSNNSQYIGWVVNLCENMEDKIHTNNIVNSKRATYINWAIYISGLIAPVIATLVAILISFYPHH
jgi:hypothetical protein